MSSSRSRCCLWSRAFNFLTCISVRRRKKLRVSVARAVSTSLEMPMDVNVNKMESHAAHLTLCLLEEPLLLVALNESIHLSTSILSVRIRIYITSEVRDTGAVSRANSRLTRCWRWARRIASTCLICSTNLKSLWFIAFISVGLARTRSSPHHNMYINNNK